METSGAEKGSRRKAGVRKPKVRRLFSSPALQDSCQSVRQNFSEVLKAKNPNSPFPAVKSSANSLNCRLWRRVFSQQKLPKVAVQSGSRNRRGVQIRAKPRGSLKFHKGTSGSEDGSRRKAGSRLTGKENPHSGKRGSGEFFGVPRRFGRGQEIPGFGPSRPKCT